MREVKIIISLFVIGIIVTIIAFVINYKYINIKNDNISKSNVNSINYKYDISKQVKEIDLHTVDDYKEYLNELKSRVEPKIIQSFININNRLIRTYMDAAITQKQTGKEIIEELLSTAYNRVIIGIVQKNQDWSDLPLTKHFRSKFNEKDGCIKEFDFNSKYISVFDMKDKIFSVEKSYIPDDAYKKYPKEVIDYMLEYNGAYNMDYYNYKFVLDEEGYLDDIIFTGITPHMVEGRFVDEGE